MDKSEKALEVDKRLKQAFRNELVLRDFDLIHELIHAVLSQNTTRKNYNLAYDRLTERFPEVAQIAGAPPSKIEEAIRPGGLSRQKSATIKEILDALERERGSLSLEFIRDMEVDEARRYLTTLPGVGPKTASVVLMFGLRREVLPVDTHVLRVSKRIGLIAEKTDAVRAERELEALVPPKSRASMHLNMVQFGREICRARNPMHEVCPLNMVCDYFTGGGE